MSEAVDKFSQMTAKVGPDVIDVAMAVAQMQCVRVLILALAYVIMSRLF